MYLACRHIKPGGERCKSPALKGHAFCYYHARLHSTTKLGVMDDVTLPVPEDSAAIQEPLGRLFQAILSSRIDSKKAAQLLWGLQIASHSLPRRPKPDPKSVQSVSRTRDGVELAPVLNVCIPGKDCMGCKDAESCDRYFDFDALMGRSKAGADETDDAGKDKPAGVKPDYENPEGEILDRDEYRMRRWDDGGDDDDDDDDADDEEDGKTLLGTLKVLNALKKTLELDE